jgi:DNA-binding NarL/FixJ family response regulator
MQLRDRRIAALAPASGMASGTTVLIVDDAQCFRRVARELLERRGYSVVGEADSAATALALAASLMPDAVLLDVRLPDANGFALCTALAECDPPPAVLLVTAEPDLGTYALLERCGARGLVAKEALAATDLSSFWPAP